MSLQKLLLTLHRLAAKADKRTSQLGQNALIGPSACVAQATVPAPGRDGVEGIIRAAIGRLAGNGESHASLFVLCCSCFGKNPAF